MLIDDSMLLPKEGPCTRLPVPLEGLCQASYSSSLAYQDGLAKHLKIGEVKTIKAGFLPLN